MIKKEWLIEQIFEKFILGGVISILSILFLILYDQNQRELQTKDAIVQSVVTSEIERFRSFFKDNTKTIILLNAVAEGNIDRKDVPTEVYPALKRIHVSTRAYASSLFVHESEFAQVIKSAANLYDENFSLDAITNCNTSCLISNADKIGRILNKAQKISSKYFLKTSQNVVHEEVNFAKQVLLVVIIFVPFAIAYLVNIVVYSPNRK